MLTLGETICLCWSEHSGNILYNIFNLLKPKDKNNTYFNIMLIIVLIYCYRFQKYILLKKNTCVIRVHKVFNKSRTIVLCFDWLEKFIWDLIFWYTMVLPTI